VLALEFCLGSDGVAGDSFLTRRKEEANEEQVRCLSVEPLKRHSQLICLDLVIFFRFAGKIVDICADDLLRLRIENHHGGFTFASSVPCSRYRNVLRKFLTRAMNDLCSICLRDLRLLRAGVVLLDIIVLFD
jgi:hypothetical protein